MKARILPAESRSDAPSHELMHSLHYKDWRHIHQSVIPLLHWLCGFLGDIGVTVAMFRSGGTGRRVAWSLASVLWLLVASGCAGSTPDPVVGEWDVTYGSPSVVNISVADGSYTVTAKSTVQVSGSHCFLPVGTKLATFSGSAGTYSGQHGLWFTNNCTFARWASVTLTLTGDKLTGLMADGERVVFTRAGAGAGTTMAPVIMLVLLAVLATLFAVALLILRRRRRSANPRHG